MLGMGRDLGMIDCNLENLLEVIEISQNDFFDVYDKMDEELTKPSTNKNDAVKTTMMYAAEENPNSNISDLWYQVVRRSFTALTDSSSPNQSWRRTGGTGLEKFIAEYYSGHLRDELKLSYVGGRNSSNREQAAEFLGASGNIPVDLVLEGRLSGDWYVFGGAHVSSNLRDRMPSDVPVSTALIERGLFSPIINMDSDAPSGLTNSGELGGVGSGDERRNRIESKGQFTNMYSLNARTEASSETTESGYRIKVADGGRDVFVKDVEQFWDSLVDPLYLMNSIQKPSNFNW